MMHINTRRGSIVSFSIVLVVVAVVGYILVGVLSRVSQAKKAEAVALTVKEKVEWSQYSQDRAHEKYLVLLYAWSDAKKKHERLVKIGAPAGMIEAAHWDERILRDELQESEAEYNTFVELEPKKGTR